MRRRTLLLIACLGLPAGCQPEPATPPPAALPRAPGTPAPAPPEFTYEIVKTYPHDPNAFTQGLVFFDGFLYESTGLAGQSSLRQVEPATGRVVRFQPLPRDFFGEGLTRWNDTLVQLTWQNGVGIVYDRNTFAEKRKFPLPFEGWGLTDDGKRLIASEGTDRLHFLDPATFAVTATLRAHDRGMPVTHLNELESVEGEVWANIWYKERVARIDPATGRVTGWIDLSGLLGPEDQLQENAVLNGIAYDAKGKRLFVTGKLWPRLFEIRVVPKK